MQKIRSLTTFNFFTLLQLMLLLISLQGCSSRKTPPPATVKPQPATIADIKNFPQNLKVYAKLAGPDRHLLPEYRQNELSSSFARVLFGPWDMTRTSVSKASMLAPFARARGFKYNSIRWRQEEWDTMRANANGAAYPSMAASAITLRNTDLRELPTHEPRFSEETVNVRDNPFDYFQQSLLPIGTPLLVAHKSLDGKWYYVECPIAGGWVDAADVALVDADFRTQWRSGRYAALIRDKVTLPGTGVNGKDSLAGIGAVLPLKNHHTDGTLDVLLPIGGTGYAKIAETSLPATSATSMPMPLTPANVALVGNQMLNQPYGWGGMLGERDCSALTRELFTPFGIWLPRNSVAQAKRGSVISLVGMTPQQKAATIMRDGVPFLSLLGMRGHITLYIGIWKGQPAIFHNAWGVRVVKDGNDDERFVIGKAVITSIEPGLELENLYRPVTFTDRLRTLTTPGN